MNETASPRTYFLIGLFFCLIGLVLLAKSCGFVVLNFLHPNPDTPQWVLAAVGLFMFLGGILSLANVVKVSSTLVNVLGWTAMAIGWLMAHWLVLFAKGAACSIGFLGVWMRSDILCFGLAGAVLVFFDLMIAFVLIGNLWPRLK